MSVVGCEALACQDGPDGKPIVQCGSGGGEEVGGSSDVAGSGGEGKLESGLGEAEPSRATEAVAAPPDLEDLLDPAAYALDRAVPRRRLLARTFGGRAPHRGDHHPRRPALGPHRRSEGLATIAAASADLAWRPGQGQRAATPVVPVAGRDRNPLHEGGVRECPVFCVSARRSMLRRKDGVGHGEDNRRRDFGRAAEGLRAA